MDMAKSDDLHDKSRCIMAGDERRKGRGGQAATVAGRKPPSPGPEAAIDVVAELARSGGGVAEPRTATGRGMAAHDDSPRACPLLSSHCGRRPPPTPPTARNEDDDEVRRQIHCRLFLRRLLFHRRCLLFSPGRRRCTVDLA
ncbi:Os03g0134100 [Oryza sativa Japonica Group]|uniref:Os03g0134100 protein n=1 Tax=Oryza sativa subsp. japonica TaxID=39947 RepID=A0A0P0VSQ2_ORYSJ|nr:Os03g0134100 [Oryza sativa Japonica Group]